MANRRIAARTTAARHAPNVGVLLSTLGDPMRQQIVEMLRGGRLSVGELSSSLPVSRPAVSQHLKVLREAGIVRETRAGARHYFALDAAALDSLRCHFESLWQDVLHAFANYVKEAERERKTR